MQYKIINELTSDDLTKLSKSESIELKNSTIKLEINSIKNKIYKEKTKEFEQAKFINNLNKKLRFGTEKESKINNINKISNENTDKLNKYISYGKLSRNSLNFYNVVGFLGISDVLILKDDNLIKVFDLRDDSSSWLEVYISEENRAGEAMLMEKIDSVKIEEREDIGEVGVDIFTMRDLDKEFTEESYDVTPEEEIEYGLWMEETAEELWDDLLDFETETGEFYSSMVSDIFEDKRYSDSDLEFDFEDDGDTDDEDDDEEFEGAEFDDIDEDGDYLDQTFTFINSSLQGKKISKFIKDLDAGDVPMSITNKNSEIIPWKFMRGSHRNKWLTEIFPNYVKTKLLHGFSYIPEQLIFRDYFNLNRETYTKNREKAYSMNRSTDHFLDLSFETTGRFAIDQLNLIDKHIWGYGTQRLEKVSKYSNYSNENNSYDIFGKRFRNRGKN